MRSLIRFGLRQAVLMNILFVGVVVFAAAWAIPRLPVDRYPNFSFGEVTVTVPWPGASAEEIERLVTKPLEDSLRGMRDLEFVKATSIRGQSELQVKFVDDTDYEALYQELRLRILTTQNRLPAVNGKPLAPFFAEVETDQWLPVIQAALIGDGSPQAADRRQLLLLAKELRLRLENLDGIKRVDLLGDSAEQYDLVLDPARLRATGTTLAQVADALSAAGIEVPAGRLANDEVERTIRIDGRFRSAGDLDRVVVRVDGAGNALTVGGLVDHGASGPRRIDSAIIVTTNGLDTVICKVVKEPWANAGDIKDLTIAELDRFQKDRAGNGFTVVTGLDTTIPITDSIGVLVWTLAQGALLVVVVLTLFVGLRAATLTVSGMAFAFLGSLLYFKLTGESINELTLLGFVIVVGIVVDDAVVVIDAIVRKREEGLPLERALIEGTSEVAWPVVSSAATTMAAFLPLLMMTGVVGEFFSLIPISVSVALALSLFEALLMLPLHTQDSERLLGPMKLRKTDGVGHLDDEGLLGRLARIYDRALTWTLHRPWTTLALTALLFFGAIGVLIQSAVAPRLGLSPLLKLEFFPSEASVAEVRVTMPTDTSLEATDALVRRISVDLASRGLDHVTSVTGMTGMMVDSSYKPQWGPGFGYIQVEIAGGTARAFDDPNAYIQALSKEIVERYATPEIRLTMGAQQGGPPTGLPISVRLRGENDAATLAAAHDLKARLIELSQPGQPLEGAIGIGTDADREETVVTFVPDRLRLAEYDLTLAEAQRFVAGLFDGIYVGDLRRSDEDIPVRLRVSRAAIADFSALGDLGVGNGTGIGGADVTYADLGTVRASREPATRIRRDFVRTIGVEGGLDPKARITAHDCSREIKAWWDAHGEDYPGVTMTLGGEAESTSRSYASLGFAFLFSLCLIYLILATQFRSYLQPVLIMTTIVFAFTGVTLVMGLLGGIALTLGPNVVRPERALFTVNTFIAVIGLAGMVVNNAIVLIDSINRRLRGGMDLDQALHQATHTRLRAVVMTTVTTIAGMLPTAIGIPAFSLTWSPMATAFIAGLSMATLLTMLVIPTCYRLLDDWFGAAPESEDDDHSDDRTIPAAATVETDTAATAPRPLEVT